MCNPVLRVWKEDLAKVSVRASQALADPSEYPNLFPDLEVALQVLLVVIHT